MKQAVMGRIGRRGLVLLLFGVAWIGWGAAIPYDPGKWVSDEAILWLYLPVPWRAAAWIVCGILAVLFAPCHRRQWVGWLAAVTMPIGMTMSYLWSALMYLVPGDPGGHPSAIGYTVRWFGITAVMVVISSWEEDSLPRLIRVQQAERRHDADAPA